MFHQEILTPEQVELLPLVKKFAEDFGLVGGTAIALHVGHRKSIDFDLFSYEEFDNNRIKARLDKKLRPFRILVNKQGEYTLVTKKGVKITFYHYPYKIDYKEKLNKIIKFPDLLTLAVMKAFALGQRAKWKDYVDLYYILKKHHSIEDVSKQGRKIFKDEYNEKLFKTQLAYFNDIDYSETVEFMPGFEVSENKIQKELIDFSIS